MDRLWKAVACGGVLALLQAGTALASCAPPPPLEDRLGDARVVFVGTVVDTSNLERNAGVRVEKIWLGERLPQQVEVHGGEQSANVASSADREWVDGRRYLFVLDDTTSPFEDEACSATTEYTDEVASLEPEGTVGPIASEPGSFSPWILVGVGLVALAMLQARRAERRAHSIDI